MQSQLLLAAVVVSTISAAESARLLLQPAPRVRHVAAVPVVSQAPAVLTDPCAELGVRLVMNGREVNVPTNPAVDNAGHKYRKNGSRATWLTAHGPVYVHAVGGALPGDGKSDLSLLMIRLGDGTSYAMSPARESTIDVTVADGARIGGRFEANVSKVASAADTPAPGAPTIPVTGTFCLPALRDNPSDTGP